MEIPQKIKDLQAQQSRLQKQLGEATQLVEKLKKELQTVLDAISAEIEKLG